MIRFISLWKSWISDTFALIIICDLLILMPCHVMFSFLVIIVLFLLPFLLIISTFIQISLIRASGLHPARDKR